MRLRTLLLAAALVGVAPGLVRAQDEPQQPTPEDKNAEYQVLFEQGLDLLRAKRYDDSIKRFQACIALFPDRAVSYYNIACAYSLKKDAKKSVDWLKKSFDKGFLDLAHVGRDTDLDNVRDEDAFKELVTATRKKILAERPQTVKIVPKTVATNAPLVVFVHGDSTNVEELAKKIGPLADKLGAYLVIPSGRVVNDQGAHWDTTAETCIVHDVKAAMKEFDVPAERVVLVGELDGAAYALAIANKNGWKNVVAAAGGYEKLESPAKDMRVYLYAPRAYDAAQAAATAARDDLLGAGAHVRVERHEGQTAFPEDVVGAIERAVKWTLGASGSSGDVKKF